jgi:tRNA threonylcarbamoyladenosine modification (KEOPS) complex  Pcc1 subunit
VQEANIMKASASIRLRFPSEKERRVVFEALVPETKVATTRSKATLMKDDKDLVLNVEANDTVALRAALNAYLRWVVSIVNVLQVLNTY